MAAFVIVVEVVLVECFRIERWATGSESESDMDDDDDDAVVVVVVVAEEEGEGESNGGSMIEKKGERIGYRMKMK